MKLRHIIIPILILILGFSAGCTVIYEDPKVTTPTKNMTTGPVETQTPEPTHTAVPSKTPTPQMTQQPSHKIEGNGNTNTWDIWLDSGVTTVSAKYYGDNNFIVYLIKDGVKLDMIFNEMHLFEGVAAFEISESGFYSFEVISSGGWTLNAEGPYDVSLSSYTKYRDNGVMFITGKGSMTSKSFNLEKGITIFNGYYLGDSDISATLSTNGQSIGKLDSDTNGPARTEIAYASKVSGAYVIDIITSGDWGFEVTQPIPINPKPFGSVKGTGDEVTEFYEITGNYMLTLENFGDSEMTLIFYKADGTDVGSVVIPPKTGNLQYLFQNPDGYHTITCLLAITANGDWSVSAVRA